MIFSLFTSIFLFFDAFVIIQFFAEYQQLIFDKKMDDLKWILGHLQSSADENKIAIREISIRAILL